MHFVAVVTFVVLLPVAALAAIASVAIRIKATRRVQGSTTNRSLAMTSAVVLCIATFVYAHGVLSFRSFDLRSTSEICGHPPMAVTTPPVRTTSWLPVTSQCRWSNGSTKDLVPAYVNPTLLACLVAVMVCAALGLLATYRNRTSST